MVKAVALGVLVAVAACGKADGGGDKKKTGTDTGTETKTGGTNGTGTGTGTGTAPDTSAESGFPAIFPADNAWNTAIADQPVDPNSATLLANCGDATVLHPDFGTMYEGKANGIPFTVVTKDQAKVPVTFEYDDESDPGPYPIPADAPIEGGPDGDGDRHVIVIDKDAKKLYEMFSAFPENGGASWKAGSGAVWDLTSNAQRTAKWTSADAAGLPIFPGLVRYEEVVVAKVVKHAFRFTCTNTRHGYVAPASHYASDKTDAKYPPMGMRVRLKAAFDISGYPASVQPILQALKTYGMLLADNGGPFFISGAPNQSWSDDDLHTLKQVKVSDLEVVKMGTVVTD